MITPGRFFRTLVLLIGGAFLIPQSAGAATKTWTGLGADANWSTAANWSPSGAPVLGDDLLFPAGASRLSNNNDTAAGTEYHTLSVTGPAGGYTLAGNAIQLAAGLTADNTSQNTVSLAISLVLPQTFSVSGDRLKLAGPIDLGANTLTFSTSSTGVVEVSGEISGAGGVTISGVAGGVVFFNASQSYGGQTNVTGGTLAINGVHLNPASTITVTGGILQYSNGGSSGNLIVNGGRVLLGGGGTSEIGNAFSLTMQPGSELQLDMLSSTMFGQLNVVSTVTLNNPTLLLAWNFTSNAGDTFLVLTKATGGPITGTFSGLPEGSTFLSNGRTYKITYVGGDGNDVVITDVTGGAVTPTPTVTPTEIPSATPTPTPTLSVAAAAVPTLGLGGLAALVGLLALSALFLLRRSSV